ncbi:dsDNA binding protein late transcription [Yersinia phage JC221]|nr:dsDNA binding protein late transcription [Yersinia phage JC221]
MSKEFLELNPDVAKQVMDLIKDTSNITTMLEGEKAKIKDNKARAKTEFGIDGKMFGKLFKLYHNQAREQYEEENNELIEMYDVIVKAK